MRRHEEGRHSREKVCIVYTIKLLMRSKKFLRCIFRCGWYTSYPKVLLNGAWEVVSLRRTTTGASFTLFMVVMALSGCTGTRLQVTPEAPAVPKPAQSCGTVAVRELTPDRVYPPAGNLTAGFARELVQSGMFEAVYYPSRADDKADLVVEGKFDVVFEPNVGANMARSFAVGLTLFLLEPVFWYEYGYDLKGRVDLYRGPQLARTAGAASRGEMAMKFLSLADVVSLEQETLDAAARSLYRQLLDDIGEYCRTGK